MMTIVGEAVVEDAVLGAEFACDLAKCHGACCTLKGGRGAPLNDEEVEIIHRLYPAVERYLPEEHRAQIAREGMTEGEPGSFATVCLDGRACVFVYYEGPVAMCAFERAFLAGEIDWRKPISCHLFPIRIRYGTPNVVRYEQIEECAPGRKAGRANGTRLHSFLRDPLERALGSSWYREAQEAAGHPSDGSDGPGRA